MAEFSNEGWNELIRHNHPIRWLIGDIRVEGRLFRAIAHPVFRVIMTAVVFHTICLLASAASGTLWIDGRPKGYFEDFTAFAFGISTILTLLAMRHMLKCFYGVFFIPSLIKGNDSDFEMYKDAPEHYRKTLSMERGSGYANRAIFAFGLVLLVVSVIVFLLPLKGWAVETWRSIEYKWSYAAGAMANLLSFGLAGGNMLWYGIGCAVSGHRMLNRIKENDWLKPISILSADRRSGFYMLARFSFAIFLMCASILPFTLCWLLVFGITIEFLVTTPILLLMIFVFFYPLWPAHSVMKIAKERELEQISGMFNQWYEVCKSLKPGDESIDKVLARMNYIQVLYDRAKRMQVWPFNTRMLVRVFSLVLLSPITTIIKEWEKIKPLITQISDLITHGFQ